MASDSEPTIMVQLLSSAVRRGWSLTQALQHVDGSDTLRTDGQFSWAAACFAAQGTESQTYCTSCRQAEGLLIAWMSICAKMQPLACLP